uniref:Sentrin-specific protease 1 n=1 Tax=Phallusia mammillata TaxID=59560 RepID=A0A6F9DSI5_9ASCI|nr:sentrin-specific protease 1 [Phallusia mammillata]
MSESVTKKVKPRFSFYERRESFFKKEDRESSLKSSKAAFSATTQRKSASHNKSHTMFDKMFRQSPNKYANRIAKHPYKRPCQINEIERCTDIKQRDQYRLLIEQYRNKSLAETENIFCKHHYWKKTPEQPETKKQADLFIDLCSTPSPSENLSIRKGNVPDLLSMSRNDTSTSQFIIPTSKYKGDLTKNVPASTLQSRFEKEIKSESVLKTPSKTFTAQNLFTPKTSSSSPIDWFSPKSPYLAKNFVHDLVKTYGRREQERKRILVEEETRARLLHEKRQIKEELLAELLEQRLKVTPKEPEPVEELSEEAESKVDDALIPFPPHQVLVEAFNISITREHMATLSGLNWLNDEVINFYMELIVERSKVTDNLPSAHAMNTFFYPKLSKQGYKSVRRWTKKVDIFSKSLVIFPVHLGVHWTLAIADFRCKELRYYDSMGGINTECLTTLKEYLESEHMDKKKTTYDASDWKTMSCSNQDIPQQLNGSDCGVFTCTFAEFLSRDAPLNFTQSHMPLLRRTMVWEILNKSLTR